MLTLAQTLVTTTPVSVLRRKVRKLGLYELESLVTLAIQRGCQHYTSSLPPIVNPPDQYILGDDELAILLMVGEYIYNPNAIRCAAQLCRSPNIQPTQLAMLAKKEKTERVLSYIARAGLQHDPSGVDFWDAVIQHLPPSIPSAEPNLPHWSRFVSMPGRQRDGMQPVQWLVPKS